MNRDEKIARARELRAQGVILREIADQLGVSQTTALRWIDPERAEADRARARAWKAANRDRTRAYDAEYGATHKGACRRCNGPVHYQRDGALCLTCRRAARHERARWIERQWAAGKSLREIAGELGWTTNRLNVEVVTLRAQGYDLPYRYTVRDGKRVKAAA